MNRLSMAVGDSLVLAQRNLIRIVRAPDLLTAFTVQPIMFVPAAYDNYADFLIPGIVIQNIAFGGFATALGLADDLNRGLIDRFRSLPMARAAVLAGRTIADIATNLLSLVIVVVVGLIVGFSFDTSFASIVLGFAAIRRGRRDVARPVRCGAPRLPRQRAPGVEGDLMMEATTAAVAAEQVMDLVDQGIRQVHFYTLNRADLVYAICHLLGLRPQPLSADKVGNA